MSSCGSWNVDDPERPRWTKDTALVAEHDYYRGDGVYSYTVFRGRNPDGEKVFATRRRNTLSFSDRLEPEDKVDWYPGLGDEKAVLYKLPELIVALHKQPGSLVLGPEGEKDVDTLRDLGFVATCSPFGAGKWQDEFSLYLTGADYVVLPDADDRGRLHAAQQAKSVKSHAKRVRILYMPEGFKDVTEWIEARRKAGIGDPDIRAELLVMIDNAKGDRNERRRAQQIAQNIKIGDDVTEPIFPEIMTLNEMHKRLVFIGRSGAVIDRETGRIRKKETARNEYAASRHEYVDKAGTPKEGPALMFWIASPNRITVDVLSWVPGAPEICSPPEPIDGARTAFNTWRGLSPMPAPDDWQERIKPFIDHVAFLVPDATERVTFLQWLAHIVQQPEVLPHTAYLMTTPKTGIGRNLLASMIVRVLRGHVAAGVSLPELLDGGFTGRLSRKLLATVDEVREGSGEKRYQRAEKLKSLITVEHRHINPKYGVDSVEKNCCRWLMFSNHRDAIPFNNSDRRIVVIENPTEQKPTDYYEKLFGLLDDNAFIASIRRQLETLDISSFRPGAHAPMSPAKKRALDEMMTETERLVHAFMDDCENELTTRSAIRQYVSWGIGGNVNENHLTYSISGAGMKSTGRSIKIGGRREHVVIVRGDWTKEKVAAASGEVLVAVITHQKKQQNQ